MLRRAFLKVLACTPLAGLIPAGVKPPASEEWLPYQTTRSAFAYTMTPSKSRLFTAGEDIGARDPVYIGKDGKIYAATHRECPMPDGKATTDAKKGKPVWSDVSPEIP